MAKVTPFHSKKPEDPNVYHDNSECSYGKNIKPENRVSGIDGRQKCSQCKDLS